MIHACFSCCSPSAPSLTVLVSQRYQAGFHSSQIFWCIYNIINDIYPVCGSTSKLEWSHQQGPQEDTDRMGRGRGGNGGQAELVESSPIASLMNQKPCGCAAYCSPRLCEQTMQCIILRPRGEGPIINVWSAWAKRYVCVCAANATTTWIKPVFSWVVTCLWRIHDSK